MSAISRYADKWINKKDRVDPESYRRGIFFLLSISLFQLISILFTTGLFIANPSDVAMHISNAILCVVLLALTVLYRFFGWRILLTNLMAFFSASGGYFTYVKNGGIYSADNVWAVIVPVWMFMVADRRSGIIWFGVSILQFVFFYYAALMGWRDFRADAATQTLNYYFSGGIASLLLMLVIVYVHDRNKEKYLGELRTAKAEVESKSRELELKNNDVISSISYAKKIQYAILPSDENISRGIPLSFLLYKPRDIVSGDFYWFHEIDRDNYILVCADCTGHGVPGAFMTLIGSSALTQIVTELKITQPARILAELDKRISAMLKQEKERTLSVNDGMDLSLIKVDKQRKEIIFSGAKRMLILVRNNELKEIKGSKLSLGGIRTGEKDFGQTSFTLEEDDMLYLFTDGYIDQFGGPDNKKFMIRRFRELLLKISSLPVPEQKQKLDEAITSWIGSNEQTDDILVMGIRY